MISTKIIRTLLRISIPIIIIGMLFKIMHWPNSDIILSIGFINILIFYPIRFYLKDPKTLLDFAKLALVITFIFHYAFHIFHWPFAYLFTIATQVSGIAFVILYLRQVVFLDKEEHQDLAKSRKSRNSKLSYLLYFVTGTIVIAGALFKIMHWPYGNEFLIAGLLLIAVSVLILDTKL